MNVIKSEPDLNEPELLRKELSHYQFDLPNHLIARYPVSQRSSSRLLVLRPSKHFQKENLMQMEDSIFSDIARFLEPGDLLVMNHARVSPRRVQLERASGGNIEAIFLNQLSNKMWDCLLRGKKRLRTGEYLHLSSKQVSSEAEKIEFLFLDPATPFQNQKEVEKHRTGNAILLPARPSQREEKESEPEKMIPKALENAHTIWKDMAQAEEWFEEYGEITIPPYLNRRAETQDKERYQTVYASALGSIAAPTAGLHFSQELIGLLRQKGVQIASLGLRIGYGTFAPLCTENFIKNQLHAERYSISSTLARLLNQGDSYHRLIAVGTTSLRALEANFRDHLGVFQEGTFETDLFLRPPDKPKSIDGLITNFHLPASSLFLLTASYTGLDYLQKAYRHATSSQYRFFSYGDAMLIL